MIRSLTVLVLLFCSTVALAQDDEAAEKPAKKVRKPVAEQSRITDPAVLAILESKPTTPAEQFDAARLLADLGQTELAKALLKKLMAAKLDDATLAGLVDKFGTPVFLRFAKIESLTPEAGQFVDSVLTAADKITRDSVRMTQYVKQLSDADVTKRQDAMVGLMRAGSFAVGPLFAAYTDPAREREAGIFREMLLRLKQDAVGPLLGVFRGGSFSQVVSASDLLGQLGAVEALPAIVAFRFRPHPDGANSSLLDAGLERLNGTLPSERIASEFLEREARRQLQIAQLIDSQDNYGIGEPTMETWRWDPKTNEAIRFMETSADSARWQALRAASTLKQMELDRSPAERSAVEELYLLSRLEEAKHRGGLQKPLPATGSDPEPGGTRFEVNNLVAILPKALSGGHEAAAIGALELLGELGSPDLLLASDGRWSPLAEAARSGDRRVRFAAIAAILDLNPRVPFAGASAVSEGLQYFAGGTGRRRAVVAHPKSRIAQQLAGYLSPLGYDVDTATNGREAFRLATQSPDVELAIIHSALDHPRADDLLTQLRKDPRTARLPIAVIAVPEYTEPAERLVRGVPRTHAFAEPQDAAGLKYQVERLLSLPGCLPIPPEVRKQQAARAVEALANYAEHPVPWLDARAISTSVERSLYNPAMTASVASLLASAGTATGQSKLVQLATRESLPLAKREAAALAFARSVAKHSILLTSDQILDQYNRYNDNAGRNKDTHKVMQIILDAIESKSEVERHLSEGQPRP